MEEGKKATPALSHGGLDECDVLVYAAAEY